MTQDHITEIMKHLPGAELIETHISWVILAGDRAWKVKKPMHYAFLDFSSAEAREKYCRRELELNRRLAPGMYLRLVKVCRQGGHLGFAEECRESDVLDHAVEMKRMTESLRLDRLMDAGKVEASQGAALGRQVAAFHRRATVVRNPERCTVAGYQADFGDIGSVREDFVRHLGAEAGARLDGVLAESLDWLAGRGELLQRRLGGGWIRDLHGDLHTRNIFVEEDGAGGEFVVFDCIEFNDAFREIDVLSEIAFLYMDVEVRGRKDFGEAFLGAYLKEIHAMQDEEEQALFNYFRRYRANVRAKVNALRARQASGEDLARSVEEMRIYLELMENTPI